MKSSKNVSISPDSVMGIQSRTSLVEYSSAASPANTAAAAASPAAAAAAADPHSVQHSLPHGEPLVRRGPLGFLSPNYAFKQRASVKHRKLLHDEEEEAEKGDTVKQLKHEISQLQQRIKLLDCDTAHEQLLDLIEEKDLQAVEKEEHLQELNKKLVDIQAGLREIEGERCQLIRKATTLERAKSSLTEQLRKREREIAALQKKCAVHTQTLSQERVEMRATNSRLLHMVGELQSKQDAANEPGSCPELQAFAQLRDSQAAHAVLVERLAELQRDHDAVCLQLKQCLVTVEQLTQEKKDWEQERIRLTQKAELELEQQRLNHIAATMELKQSLASRETKVGELDRLLSEKIMTIARLRRQLGELEDSQAAALKQVTVECGLKLKDACDTSQSREQEFATAQANWQAKLNEKAMEIESLRNDVSSQMQELMATTSELQKCQEDSKLLAGLMEDVEALEQDRYNLQEDLHERDTAIAELSAEILKLEIELQLASGNQEGSQTKSDALQAKLAAAEQEKAAMQLEIWEITASNAKTVKTIRDQYDAAICTMKEKLVAADSAAETQTAIHQELVNAKDKTIASLLAVSNKENRKNCELETLRQELQSVTEALVVKEDEILEQQATKLSAKDETIESLQNEVARLTADSQANTIETESLQGEIRVLRSKASNLEELATERAQDYQKDVKSMSQALADLQSEHACAQSEILEQGRQLEQAAAEHKRLEAEGATKLLKLKVQVQQLQSQVDKERTASSLAACDSAGEEEQSPSTQVIFELRSKIADLVCNDAVRTEEHAAALTQAKQAAFDQQQHDLQVLQTANSKQLKLLEEAKQSKSKMEEVISDLKRELEFSNISLTDLKRKLEEETKQRTTLASSLQSAQAGAAALQKECRQLRQNVESAENERDKLSVALEKLQLGRQGSGQEESLREDLAVVEKKIVDQEQQMVTLEEALQERSTLLSETVAENKDLRAKLNGASSEYRALQEESSLLQVRVQDKEAELKRRQVEWQRTEDQYLGEIHEERNIREVTEADLTDALTRLQTVRIESKSLSELEKENTALKDKVRRQEAYLERKIKQDKAVRVRTSLAGSAAAVKISSTGSSSAVLKSPAQIVSRGAALRAVSPPSPSKETRSTVSGTDSIERDLDFILAD